MEANHENFTGRCDCDKKIFICQGCSAQRLFSELPDKVWKLGSIDSLLKRIRTMGTIVRQPGSGRPRSAYSSRGNKNKNL